MNFLKNSKVNNYYFCKNPFPMDTFFWTSLLVDIIRTTGLVVLGSLAALALIPYYLRLQHRYRKLLAPAVKDLDESKRITLPLRLQAFERIIMFLERIKPVSLVMRVQKPEMNVQELQLALTRIIREEFDYNLSQQVYMSPTAWEMIKNAREESLSVINRAAGQFGPEEPSSTLVRAIFEISLGDEIPVNQAALNYVKDEARLLM
jgi:hypothetical protein